MPRTTLYKHVPELRPDGGGRAALIRTVQAEALAADDATQLPGRSGLPLPTTIDRS
ncbi:hypothetical protein [Pseudonocardia endophytica]|uniref:hypothetical protein n=1 Tax=Pseudonocardia endophytica TaxID=401976 RepID=UPI001A9E4062|nr:hypothetical protein [Pseudonocardia endophytica]